MNTRASSSRDCRDHPATTQLHQAIPKAFVLLNFTSSQTHLFHESTALPQGSGLAASWQTGARLLQVSVLCQGFSLSLSLSLSLTHTHTLSLSHAHTHSLSLSLSEEEDSRLVLLPRVPRPPCHHSTLADTSTFTSSGRLHFHIKWTPPLP